MAAHVFRNPRTGTVWQASGTNAALLLSWGWVQLDDGPPPVVPDPFPQYVEVRDLEDPQHPASVALRAAFDTPRIVAEPALLPLRIALANADTARVSIPIIGDSQTEGQGVTDVGQRWVHRASAALRNRLGLPAGGRGYFGPGDTGQDSFTYPATTVGSVATNGDQGAKILGVTLGSPSEGINYALRGTSADVMYVTYGGGPNFTTSVDGGATASHSTAGPFQDGNLVRVALGTSDAHTLAVRGVSGPAYHTGVIEYDGDEDAGVTFHDCGRFGWTAAQWNQYLTSAPPVGQAINALAPTAIGIALGHNEANQGIPHATFRANLVTLIGKLRAAATDPNPPILLIGYPATSEGLLPWQGYLDAMASVAADDAQVAFLDLSRKIPDHEVPGLYADPTHGNAKWHGAVAQALADFLVPLPVPEFGTGSGVAVPAPVGATGAVAGRLYHSTSVTTASGPGPTIVPFDTADYLDGGVTSSAAGLVAPVDGVYAVNAVAWFLGGGVGSRVLLVYVNGEPVRQFSGHMADGGGAELRLPGADQLRLNAGDVVKLGVYHAGTVTGSWEAHSNNSPMDIGLGIALLGTV